MQVAAGVVTEPGGAAPGRSALLARRAWPFVLALTGFSVIGSLAWLVSQRFNALFTGEPVRFGFWPLTAQEPSLPWLVVSSVPVLIGLSALTYLCRRRGARGGWQSAPVPVVVTVTGMVVFVLGVALRVDLLAWSAAVWTVTGAAVLLADRTRRRAALLVVCAVQAGVVGSLVGLRWPLVGGPQTLAVRSYQLASVAASPVGRHLATITRFGDLEVTDLDTGAVSHRKLDQGSCWARFSADGRTLMVSTYLGRGYTLEVATGAWHPGPGYATASVGTAALASDGTGLWVPIGVEATVQRPAASSVTTKRLSSLRAVPGEGGGPLVSAAGLSADGRVAAVGYDDGQVVVADVGQDRRVLGLPASAAGQGRSVWVPYKNVPAGAVSAVALAPDARTLAVATVDGRIRLLDVDSGKPRTELERPLLSGDAGRAMALEFSADGRRLLAGYLNGAVQLWTLPAAGA
jgi:hypothetical protein